MTGSGYQKAARPATPPPPPPPTTAQAPTRPAPKPKSRPAPKPAKADRPFEKKLKQVLALEADTNFKATHYADLLLAIYQKQKACKGAAVTFNTLVAGGNSEKTSLARSSQSAAETHYFETDPIGGCAAGSRWVVARSR